MIEVNRSWGQWAGELAGRARDAAEDAVEVAMEATGTDVAIDYWSSKSPEQVTHAFRNATDEWVTDRFGEAAGDAARLATVPLGAAARFSVAGVQAFDHTAQRATDIANGRAAMPTPGELIGGAAMGAVAMTGQGVDAGIRAVKDGVRAAAEGDIEGIAAAAENSLKATLDVGTVVAGAQGLASGVKSMMGPGGGAARFAAAGAASPLAVGLASPVAAGLGKIGASIGAVGTLSQAPMESRGRGRRSWGKANETRPPRSHEGLVEWPKTKTPDAKPRGPREKIDKGRNADEKRDIELQLEATDALAKEGFDVEQLPKRTGRTSPELKLNGEVFDVYSPRENTAVKAVRGHIQTKVAKEQTRRVVVNLDRVGIEPRKLSIALDRNRAQHRGLREVIAVYDGKITRIYPRRR